ncbi:MAG: tyrosine-type recombinase/integrase [Alphaproteobacteria bacterium]|nr:tyrosine-type recombinase/integrase [Alphaproteobacteria bacterium]
MAEDLDVKIDYPGLLIEKLPSGARRYRVRVEGDKARRIPLSVTPDHPQFRDCYLAARRGIRITPEDLPEAGTERGSIAWATFKHLDHLDRLVARGLFDEKTVKKRRLLYGQMRDFLVDGAPLGEFALRGMPSSIAVQLRDSMVDRPAWADSMMEAGRGLFKWCMENAWADVNPFTGIGKLNRGGGGAVPWTPEDLQRFRQAHPPGTKPYLALTIFMFTAARIGDVVGFGRANEFDEAGVRWLGWQPAKKGSSPVRIPMAPQLYAATRAATVQGPTYILSDHGRPYSTPDSLGQVFRRWCREAGLENRSPHGIRKAAGHLLAQAGCSQYHIMTIHGHSEARTSEIYTAGIRRAALAADAMQHLSALDW